MTLFVHSSIQIHPRPIHFHVRLIGAPGSPDDQFERVPATHELSAVANDPAQNRRGSDRYPQLGCDGGKIPIAQSEPQVPAHTQNDHVIRKPVSGKQRIANSALSAHPSIVQYPSLAATEPKNGLLKRRPGNIAWSSFGVALQV